MNNECSWQKPVTMIRTTYGKSESVHYSLFMAAPTHTKKMED